jgi:hypothetical protein
MAIQSNVHLVPLLLKHGAHVNVRCGDDLKYPITPIIAACALSPLLRCLADAALCRPDRDRRRGPSAAAAEPRCVPCAPVLRGLTRGVGRRAR